MTPRRQNDRSSLLRSRRISAIKARQVASCVRYEVDDGVEPGIGGHESLRAVVDVEIDLLIPHRSFPIWMKLQPPMP
jgi:hypothetical protein